MCFTQQTDTVSRKVSHKRSGDFQKSPGYALPSSPPSFHLSFFVSPSLFKPHTLPDFLFSARHQPAPLLRNSSDGPPPRSQLRLTLKGSLWLLGMLLRFCFFTLQLHVLLIR